MPTGTLAPSPKFYGWHPTTGAPLAGGLLYTSPAGIAWSTTPLPTYTNVGLTVANSNPVVLNSAGYCVLFLTPGLSYRFELQTSAGVVVWTQDNIEAVPGASAGVDVTGTAGEALSANDAVFLSDGSGGLTTGRWYQMDADSATRSTDPLETGFATAAIASGSTGSIRQRGSLAGFSGLSAGSPYYASATAGAVTSTAPTLARLVGVALSATELDIDGLIVTLTNTATLTNKRITSRITTITSSATPTVNSDNCDAVSITALATAITSATSGLTGTPTNFQKLIYRLKDDGTGRAITWGASFVAKGAPLPTTTVANKLLTVGFIYDTVAATWGCVASASES